MLGLKLRWWLFWHEREQRKALKMCRRGWHKITTQKVKVQSHDGKKWVTHYDDTYLKCVYCGWVFFPTKEQKEAYLKYKRREERQNKLWIEAIVKGSKKNAKANQSKRL